MIEGVELPEGLTYWVVFDTRTGEIVRSGLGPGGTLELQATGEFEAVMPGRGSDLTHRVVNGQIVEIEQEPMP